MTVPNELFSFFGQLRKPSQNRFDGVSGELASVKGCGW